MKLNFRGDLDQGLPHVWDQCDPPLRVAVGVLHEIIVVTFSLPRALCISAGIFSTMAGGLFRSPV